MAGAVHESGHALVAALSDKAYPVAKVTILPAGMALGVTEQLPLDERCLRDSFAMRLVGRAAAPVVLGEGPDRRGERPGRGHAAGDPDGAGVRLVRGARARSASRPEGRCQPADPLPPARRG